MSTLSRTVFFGFQAAALVATVGPALVPLVPLSALAAPIPVPMPLMPHIADYASQPPVRDNTTEVSPVRAHGLSVTPQDHGIAAINGAATNVSPLVSRQDSMLSALQNMKTQGALIQEYASSSRSAQDDPAFGQNVKSALSSFQLSLLDLKSLLGDQQKGLANYDPNNAVETLLKDLINLNKQVLNAVDVIVYNLPVLGPVLGPIVYEIKCLLDAILDLIENLVDGILNAVLRPLLEGCIAKAITLVCNSVMQLGDLCVAVL